MRVRVRTFGEVQTVALGRALAAVVRPGDLVAIDGEMGAGKTRLVRGLAEGLGVDPRDVSSPTFVVVNSYEAGGDAGGDGEAGESGGVGGGGGGGGSGGGVVLHHVDAYRLGGGDELETLGWDRVTDGSAVVAVEWAERVGVEDLAVGSVARQRVLRVRIQREGQERRLVELIGTDDPWGGRTGWLGVLSAGECLPAERGDVPGGWAVSPGSRRPVPFDAPSLPFFDERERQADLGAWFDESYTVSRDVGEADFDDPDVRPGS